MEDGLWWWAVNNLVGGDWNMTFIYFYEFPYDLGRMIPTDFHIFQRGWNHQPDEILETPVEKMIKYDVVDQGMSVASGWWPFSKPKTSPSPKHETSIVTVKC